MSLKLSESGFPRTTEECRGKVKALRRDYFKAKTVANKSGEGAVKFRWFEEMDRILGCRPTSDPPAHLDTLADDDSLTVNTLQDLPLSLIDVPTTVTQEDTNKPICSDQDHTKKRKTTPTKDERQRPVKKSKSDQMVEALLGGFMRQQEASEKKFLEAEQRREEAEEKRRQEDKEHELKLFGMLCNAMTQASKPIPFPMQFPAYNTPSSTPSKSGDFTYVNL